MLRKMKSSVKFKLLATVLIITLLPLMLAGYLNYKTSADAVYDMAVQNLTYITELKVRELDQYLGTNKQLEGESLEMVNRIVQEVHQNFYQPAGLTGYGYLLDERGVALVHLDPDLVGYDVSAEEFGAHILVTKEGYYEYPWRGDMRVASYAQLANGWIFAITLPLPD